MGNPCDSAHEISNCKVDHMRETGQAMLEGVERIDAAGIESGFDVVAHGVVVAGVVGSYTKKLLKFVQIRMARR